MSVAVCDFEAFFPFRRLVEGPLTDLRDLNEVERFVRAVVLHDEISMKLQPLPYQGIEEEFTEEEKRAGGRNVIVSMGPVLTDYNFFTKRSGSSKPKMKDVTLSSVMIEAARMYSNAEEGNIYYNAHIDYLEHVVSVVRKGGSALIAGEFGSHAINASSDYPKKLFEKLDRDWQKFAIEADAGELGLIVPPVLSIILTRCSRRDAIPNILRDLRNEWADARAKVWALLDHLKTIQTVSEAQRIRQELAKASQLMSPAQDKIDSRPIQVLWDIIAGSAAGCATSLISGGNPGVGAVVGALGMASKSVPPLIHELGPALFGRGAFDLARRIRHEAMSSEYDSLAKLLTDTEKRKLRL